MDTAQPHLQEANSEMRDTHTDRKCSISKKNDRTTNPGNDEISDKNVPSLRSVLRVEKAIHSNADLGAYTSHRG